MAANVTFALHTGDMVDREQLSFNGLDPSRLADDALRLDAVWKSIRKDVEDGVGQGHSQYGTHLSAPLYGVIGNQYAAFWVP